MHERDLGWLAGILEGEGCFISTLRPGGTMSWCISVNMTDRDVLERVVGLVGDGCKVTGPYPTVSEKHRPLYHLNYGKRDELRELLQSLLPLMGERRSVRINEMLAEMDANPRRRLRIPACGTESGYKNKGCRCDPCTQAVRAAESRRRVERKQRRLLVS